MVARLGFCSLDKCLLCKYADIKSSVCGWFVQLDRVARQTSNSLDTSPLGLAAVEGATIGILKIVQPFHYKVSARGLCLDTRLIVACSKSLLHPLSLDDWIVNLDVETLLCAHPLVVFDRSITVHSRCSAVSLLLHLLNSYDCKD